MIERYNPEKAREEADKMTAIIQSGEAESYPEAASLVFWRSRDESSTPLTEKALEQRVEIILGNLGLSLGDLRNKKVLDVGAGERPIAAYCQLKGITSDVYSADPNIYYERYASSRALENWPTVKAQIDKKTVKDKSDKLSFEDGIFDLVINHAALPGFGKALREGDFERMKAGISNFFDETVRVLRPGGEARMFPAETGSSVESVRTLFKPRDDEVIGKLGQLARDGICTVVIEEAKNEYFERSKNGNRAKSNLHRIIIRKN